MVRVALLLTFAVADIVLTRSLLTADHGSMSFYESNPIANWFLTRFGWMGISLFKVATIAVLLGVVVVIARSRPRTGKNLLTLGILAQIVVVLYSANLMASSAKQAQEEFVYDDAVIIESEENLSDVSLILEMRNLVAKKDCDFNSAVEELLVRLPVEHPGWVASFKRANPDLTFEQAIRVYFYKCIVDTCANLTDEDIANLKIEYQKRALPTGLFSAPVSQ